MTAMIANVDLAPDLSIRDDVGAAGDLIGDYFMKVSI